MAMSCMYARLHASFVTTNSGVRARGCCGLLTHIVHVIHSTFIQQSIQQRTRQFSFRACGAARPPPLLPHVIEPGRVFGVDPPCSSESGFEQRHRFRLTKLVPQKPCGREGCRTHARPALLLPPGFPGWRMDVLIIAVAVAAMFALRFRVLSPFPRRERSRSSSSSADGAATATAGTSRGARAAAG